MHNRLALTGARLLDPEAGTLLPNRSILIEDGRIAAVEEGLAAPEGTETIALEAKVVMPGMIDCHMHVVAETLNLWDNVLAPTSLSALRSARVLEETLRRGFTTVRDLGGADIGLVRGVEEGLIDGPRLVICGKGLTTTGGHADLRGRTDDRATMMHYRLGSMGYVVALERVSPRKSRSALRPPPPASPPPRLPAGLPAAFVVAVLILRPEALHARPGVDQRAVHREMVAAHLATDLRMRDDPGKEPRRRLHRQEPLAVLCKRRCVPYRFVDPEADEPAEQQVEVEPLYQLALGPDRVERLKQEGAQQPLGRDRRRAPRGIGRIERAGHTDQNLVRDPTDHPQRVARRDPALDINIRKQAA